MKKFAENRAVLGCLLAGLMLFALCGCGTQGEQADSGKTASVPGLLQFYGDNMVVYNTDGLQIGADEDYDEVTILTDRQNNQTGVMFLKIQFSSAADTSTTVNEGPVPESSVFSFYTPQGELVRRVELPGDAQPAIYNGSLTDCYFQLTNEQERSYTIFDTHGQELITKVISAPEDMNLNYLYLYYTGKLLLVNYEVADSDWTKWDNYLEAFMPDGTPAPLGHREDGVFREYLSVIPIYDSVSHGDSQYYQAEYEISPGNKLYDVITADGTAVIGNLRRLHTYGQGVLACEQGNYRGLMDMQGKWICKESIFDNLSD